MKATNATKITAELAAYRARRIARFNAQHEGMISRTGGRVMVYRAGVWTRK